MNHDLYGLELATKIAEYLMAGKSIHFEHYGYCGVGFIFYKEQLLYTHFDEWCLYMYDTRYTPGGPYTGIVKSFAEPQAFIAWLAQQSDHSLHGYESADPWYMGNQRITRERLIYALNSQG